VGFGSRQQGQLVEDVTRFRNAKERYSAWGSLPSRLLAYGPPGTGKTFVGLGARGTFRALGLLPELTEFNIAPDGRGQSDSEGHGLLFEDIDCMKGGAGARKLRI